MHSFDVQLNLLSEVAFDQEDIAFALRLVTQAVLANGSQRRSILLSLQQALNSCDKALEDGHFGRLELLQVCWLSLSYFDT